MKVKQLLAAGGDANSTDYAGWTPLHEACNHGNLESVRELLKSRQPVLEINSEYGTCFALQSVSADQILSERDIKNISICNRMGPRAIKD